MDEQAKALQVWRTLRESCPSNDISEMELFVLHGAHDLYRKGEINAQQFAIVMDEAVCF